ncbi:unnamed protein product [Caenorhabditis nigoni]
MMEKREENSLSVFALNMTVEDICHLPRFYGKLLSISSQDLGFLKKTFVTSSDFGYSRFEIRNFNENEERSNIWGPPFIDEFSSLWYFRIDDSKILELESRENIFHFKNVKLNDVPNGAIVHDYNEN